MKKVRIVILGGGFGGFYAAQHLDRLIGSRTDIEVILVSRENFILFTPMLHEVAAGDLDPGDIICPLRQMLKHVEFLEADVEEIDLPQRRVSLAYSVHRRVKELTFDHLVLALGSESNFFHLPGVEERSLGMKSVSDAFVLHNTALAMLELANLEQDALAKQRFLTFVVAGGGFAGVETMGALNDFVRNAMKYYPSLSTADLRMVLVHAGHALLPELDESLGNYAQSKLESAKVEIFLQKRVAAFSNDGVELASGEKIRAATLVWTAGVTPPALVDSLPCHKEKGRIVAKETMEVADFPGVWALGDCAWVPNPATGQPHPPTAQHAIRQGAHCAKNILAVVDGRRPAPFRFKTLGGLATVGHHSAVANIMGIRLSGFIAWCLWRAIYLAKLPRWEKRIRVLLRWMLDLIFPNDLSQHLSLADVERVHRRISYLQQEDAPPETVHSI